MKLSTIAQKMAEEVELKDRKYYMKTYSNCFLGTEAVKWMTQSLEISKEEAVKLGQSLLFNDFIHHITRKEQFEDKEHLYKFTNKNGRSTRAISGNCRKLHQ